MRALFTTIFAMLLGGCTVEPASLPIIEPAQFKLNPNETYAVVSLENPSSVVGKYALCRLDGSGQYEVNAGAVDYVGCNKPDLGLHFGELETLVVSGDERILLGDGTLVRIMPIVDGYASPPDATAAGDYAIVARLLQNPNGNRDLFSGTITTHRIVPGAVHYLGHVSLRRAFEWRDPGEIAERLALDFQGLTVDQVITTPPTSIAVECAGRKTAKCRILAEE